MYKLVVRILLPVALFAPRALASEESSSGQRAVVEVGTAEGVTLGSRWEVQQSYGLSLLSAGEFGQGFGARLSLLPPPNPVGPWEVSADAVARIASDSPLYFKGVGGVAVALPDALQAQRLRAGLEVGLNTTRSGFGMEAGLVVLYTFPPTRPLEGQVVVSVGFGILFGVGSSSPAPRRAAEPLPVAREQARRQVPEDSAWHLPEAPSGMLLTRGVGGVRSRPSAGVPLEYQPLGFDEGDVIQQILLIQKPLDVASWWTSGPGEHIERGTHPLSEWEQKYIEAMSSPTVPEPIRMLPPVTPERLNFQQARTAEQLLGKGPAAVQGYSNWENRRRIVKHYFVTHPATLNLSLGLYGFSRDANLLHFALERGWQMGGGKEMFTEQKVSRLGAGAEFFAMVAAGVATGKLMGAARPVTERSAPAPLEPVRPGPGRGQVIPLDRARTPRTPSSPEAQPPPSVDEQLLPATGTDGAPYTGRPGVTGNESPVASLRPPGQDPGRGAAPPPSTSQPPRVSEPAGASGNPPGTTHSNGPRSRPMTPRERPERVASAAGEEVSSLESLVDVAAGDTMEVVQAKFAMEEALSPGMRLPRNVEMVRRVKPSVDRPRADVSPDDVRWREYCEYYDKRLTEMEAAEAASKLESVDSPRSWSSYQTLRNTFERGIKYQRARTAALRAQAANGQLPGFSQPHIQANAGVIKVDLRFADVIIIERQVVPGQPPRVETYSFKSCDFKLLDIEEARALIRAHARDAVRYYGGELDIRTPEVGMRGERVKVTKAHLVYDAEFMPSTKEAREALLQMMKDVGAETGVEVRFE